MSFLKIFNRMRDQLKPKRTYNCELLIHSDSAGKFVAKCVVSTTARSKGEAQRNIQADIRLHIGKVKLVNDNGKLNGHAKV